MKLDTVRQTINVYEQMYSQASETAQVSIVQK